MPKISNTGGCAESLEEYKEKSKEPKLIQRRKFTLLEGKELKQKEIFGGR